MSILNIQDKPEAYPLFGGTTDGLFLRTDVVEHPILKQLCEAAFGKFWTVNMIDFTSDKLGFSTLPVNAQRMFKLNNGYQSLMDSGVVGIYSKLVEATSNIELSMVYLYIAQNESIHATSYSDGLIQMFGADASKVIDIVYTDPVVAGRLNNEVAYADNINTSDNISIFKAIAATYVLERVKFPFSFFVTSSINNAYANAINGFSLLIKKIAEDELDIHGPVNAYVLKQMIKSGLIDAEFGYSFINDLIDEVRTAELEWNKYLQADGPIPGYTEAVGEDVINYFANKAKRDVGIKVDKYPQSASIQWFNHYLDISNQVVAQQEVKSNSYQKGVLKNDLKEKLKGYHE